VLIDSDFAVPLAAMVAVVMVVVLHRRAAPAWRLVAVGIFCVYLGGVASQTLFPIAIGQSVDLDQRTSFWTWMNLEPFKGLGAGILGRQQAFLNVLLGVPFGVLVPFLGSWSARGILLLGGAFAIGIEALQFVEDAIYGYGYRAVDINDVMLNWLGVAIGLAAYLIAAITFTWWPGRARGDMPDRS
jgi:glycopeptide antibiotics resistance protein